MLPGIATFLTGASTLTTTLISGATGTAIGGMTGAGGVAASFDGTTNQASVSCSRSAAASSGYVSNNAVGKDWGSGVTKTITKMVAYSPNDSGFLGSNAAIGWKLQGSTDNFSASTVDLASGTAAGGTSDTVTVSGGSITTTTAYRYHRFVLNGNGANNTWCAEVQFYEDV